MNPNDGRLKLVASCVVALWLMLVGQRADAVTVVPANPTITVGQNQQFTATGAAGTPTAVSAGAFFSCVRLSDGTAQCTGRDQFGQLGNDDGTFTSSSVPVAVSGLTTATRVVAGAEHACALLGDSTVRCWGAGDSGQRGDGTFNNSSTVPVAVGGLTGAVSVVTGGYHTCALLGDGTVWCWGGNIEGQLGDGTSGSSSSPPVHVSGISSAVAVSGGYRHTCALLGDGTVQCWGRNLEGQLGDGTTTSSPTPVRVGGITGAVAIAAGQGGVHTCALLADGSVKCWGALGAGNGGGQLGNGSTTGSATPVTMTGTGGTGVTWASSNTTVATIDATGLATGRSAGITTITATDGSGANATTTLTVRQQTFILTVTKAGTGSGTVTSSESPPRINCDPTCSTSSVSYESGAGVTLTASAASGSTFAGWNGAGCSSTGACTMTMSAPTTVTATFASVSPTITSQPASQTVTAGQTATFSVTAT